MLPSDEMLVLMLVLMLVYGALGVGRSTSLGLKGSVLLDRRDRAMGGMG